MYNIVDLYKKRSDVFINRTVSILSKLDFSADYENELDEFYSGLMESNYNFNEYDVAEAVQDYSSSLADEYNLLNDGIFSAVLVGYYHLWERDIKDLCKRYLRYHSVLEANCELTENTIQRYKYEKVKDFLVFMGAEEAFFNEINVLRLLVNTIKHSSGPSAKELFTHNKKYYLKIMNLCDLEYPDRLECNLEELDLYSLNINDLTYFGAVVNDFWTILAKRIYI